MLAALVERCAPGLPGQQRIGWASPDPLAVHAPGEADLNLYAYVHGRVYAATDPLGLEGLETMADGMLHQAMNAGQQAAANEFSRGVLETTAKAVAGGAICTQYAPLCVGAAAVRLATEGYDHAAAGKVLAEESLTLAGARFATRGKPGAPSQAIVEKELAATAAPLAPLGEAAGGIPRAGSLSNEATRAWYKARLGEIPSRLDQSLPLRERALQAFKLRNEIKLQARELMADRVAAASLPAPRSLADVVGRAYESGARGDDVWRYVLRGSGKSNAAVDAALGL